MNKDLEDDESSHLISSESSDSKLENLSKFPRYGWKVTLDHTFPEKRDQYLIPRLKQLPHLTALFIRYILWYVLMRIRGKKPWIDCIAVVNGKQIYGVPLGGIGSGTIGRGFKGEFCRYQMVPGIYEYNSVLANQFIVTIRDPRGNTLYQKVLSPLRPNGCLSAWDWEFNGSDGLYCGLYPRSWTVYNIPDQKVRLICRQVSPVFPHNYKDTSFPVGVFIWTIENNCNEPRDISITFTFKNGTGGKADKLGECWGESFEHSFESTDAVGVILHQTLQNMNLRYAISVRKKVGLSASYCIGFDPLGTGESLWNDLKMDGELESQNTFSSKTRNGEERAVAICGKSSIAACGKSQIEMALVWDMPKIVFRGNGQTHTRYYSRWFGNEESSAQELSSYSLHSYKEWENIIEQWQSPILGDKNLPDWFKSALFNELYFISDGGSVWTDIPSDAKLPSNDPRLKYGRFAYLEGHEYRMYNTYDVHFYASWALVLLWPELQKSLQYDIADATVDSDLTMRTYFYCGNKAARKVPNTVPHDLGDPEDEPFIRVNAYQIHDVSQWKDLNLKFVLQVYRDYKFFNDSDYLSYMWPICRAVIDHSFMFDSDSDGLIENAGKPDQTYDSWIMHGPSAYCCSLWVASLAAMLEMSVILNDSKEEEIFTKALSQAKLSMYEKLWNGQYFKFDSCTRHHSNSIMADQLVGHWYLTLSGAKVEVFRRDIVKSALSMIYNFNVKKFKNGQAGAVNGMNPDGTVDSYTLQSEEAWTGVTYALASTMIFEGMIDEGFQTAEGIYRTVYEKIGLGFETPEAIYSDKKYRSVGYMRPLSIWSMYLSHTLNKDKSKDLTNQA